MAACEKNLRIIEDLENCDYVCSEVHTFSDRVEEEGENMARFRFSFPSALSSRSEIRESKEPEYDSDGDIVVRRRGDDDEGVVLLQHDLSTPLAGVGKQIWRGSLLLADYFLHNHQKMANKKVLELGSGTGLAAIIASFCGAKVVATDINGVGVLERIKENILKNNSLLKADILVKPCDFRKNKYSELMENFDLIVAGDIIYDDDITDTFIDYLESVWQVDRSVEVLISLEKRFVFTLQALDTVAPAYDYFRSKLTGQEQLYDLRVQDISVKFKQYFCYDKESHMVLISIKCNQIV